MTKGHATRTAAAVLTLLTVGMTATPARAAAPATPVAPVVQAGPAWSLLMQRKLVLRADTTRRIGELPALQAAITARNTELAATQQQQAAAAAGVTAATAADQTARAQFAVAHAVAVAAKKRWLAEQKRKPAGKTMVARARRALTVANATLRDRAVRTSEAATALQTARSAYAKASTAVATAAGAVVTATRTVTDAQTVIAGRPQLDAKLAAQAAALSSQVVTQTRANFTAAQTTQVYGVTVNRIVAYPFQRMLDDAARAGVPLSGGGFRTREQQIALRTANGCPDVWTAPASSCRVPTAIPGRSLHELGLAVDITSGGRSIGSRQSPAFVWLAANAGRYGFVNLPSEPWHWSITGG